MRDLGCCIHMRRQCLAVLLPAILAGAGCNTEYENPFQGPSAVAPAPAADILFTSNSYSARAGQPRELFAVEDSGAGLTRLTFCNSDPERCDNVEAAVAPD